MKKLEPIYEGKAKTMYATDSPNLLIAYFKDDMTAFNGKRKEKIQDKGVINCAISSMIFDYLEKNGIKTHFVERLSPREMVVKKTDIIPLEVVVRNYAAGSFTKRYGVEKGTKLEKPLVEFFYKSDKLDDPMVCPSHIYLFGLASESELADIQMKALKVNDLLTKFFSNVGIKLVDFKLEFGRFDGDIILADEVSPDDCRLWDANTGEVLDKDRFRLNLGDVMKGYREVYRRLTDEYEESSEE